MTPNTENIRAWVDALRSGDYEQGIGLLRTQDDKYCCLGVATDITPGNVWALMTFEDDDPEWASDEVTNVLPPATMEWLGVDDSSPTADRAALWVLNDVNKRSFDQIADAIEKEYLS